MAYELNRQYNDPSATLYAIVFNLDEMKVRNISTATWVTYVKANVGNYDVPMPNIVSNIFAANMPAGIEIGTRIRVAYYLQDGALPDADTDNLIHSFEATWTGTLPTEDLGDDLITLEEGENCYGNLADAESYFLTRYDADAWDDATTTQKKKALISATRIIDRLNFEGEKTDDDQTLQFPRADDVLVPAEIKIACYEIAFALLDGVDPELEARNLDLTATKYGNVSASFNGSQNEYIRNGIPSFIAWTYLKSFIRDRKGFVIRRQS